MCLFTEKEHFPDDTSEICEVNRNRTLCRRYITNVFCAQKQNTFQAVHQKCVMCTETEHFPNGTYEGVFAGHKMAFKNKTRPFTLTPIYQHIQLTHNKSHT